jgi:hypothetical protein
MEFDVFGLEVKCIPETETNLTFLNFLQRIGQTRSLMDNYSLVVEGLPQLYRL